MTDKDFSNLDPIVPEREERIGRGKSQSTQAGGTKHPKKEVKSSSSSKGRGDSVLWKLLVLILVVGLGGLGYFFVQQTGQLNQLQNRFDALEAKIVSTDESLSQSGAALGIKLKDHDVELDKHWSEIKKLWGISYDRNRKNIESLQKTLAAQEKTLKGLQASMAARKKEVSNFNARLDKNSKSLDAVVNSSMAVKLEMNDLVSQSQSVTDQVNKLKAKIDSLKQNLNSRVATNEEAIGAIDAYRLQVNRDIQQIKQQLNTSPSSSSP